MKPSKEQTVANSNQKIENALKKGKWRNLVDSGMITITSIRLSSEMAFWKLIFGAVEKWPEIPKMDFDRRKLHN